MWKARAVEEDGRLDLDGKRLKEEARRGVAIA
jgi:hypothetical protein